MDADGTGYSTIPSWEHGNRRDEGLQLAVSDDRGMGGCYTNTTGREGNSEVKDVETGGLHCCWRDSLDWP